jgi:hypothetical protein
MRILATKLFCILTVVLVLTLVPAGAGVVTSIPGGTVVPMPASNYFGPGPETFGPGITWTSTNASNQGGSVFGYTGGYGFAANGGWDGALGPMAGLNDGYGAFGVTDSMTFTFATPVSAVGGFFNYEPYQTTPTTIAVYDVSDILIESYNLTFLTGGGNDVGQFLGFQESSAIIGSFVLTDNYISLVNLTYAGGSAVPEPGTLFPAAAGVLLLAGLIRRKIRA